MLSSGQRLGPYEILSKLGAGGMGEVYKAKDTRLDRTVAIKVLPSHLSSNPDLKQRFEREARSISSLNHPYICTLFDVGHQDGTDYLVMEYIEGETLAARLLRGPLPTQEVLLYSIQIAEALHKAHQSGIVHRDLKPGNIMITKSGAKLLDFGLAKLQSIVENEEGRSSLPTKQTDLTDAGTVLGTVQYMAPEQLEGRPADARTDIFALGAVIYEMATGQKAFQGSTQASIIAAILKEEPKPISSVQPMTPESLERVVHRCLSKDPDDRWQNARDIVLELRAMPITSRQTQAVAAKQNSSFPLLAITGWVLAIILGFLTLWQFFGKGVATINPMKFFIDPPSGFVFQGTIEISPDGNYFAFVARDTASRRHLFLKRMDALEIQQVPNTDGAAFPFWSPDSKAVGFFANSKLKKFILSTNTVETLCDAPDARGGSWNRSGDILFSVYAGGNIKKVLENGGTPVEVRALEQDERSERFPEFLPDGDHYLFHVLNLDPKRIGIYVSSLHSKDAQFIVSSSSTAEYAPSGELVFISGGALVKQAFDLKTFRLTGQPQQIADDPWWSGWFPGEAGFSVSNSGTLAYRTGGIQTQQLRWIDRTGKDLGPAAPPGAYYEPALSSDEKRVLVSGVDSRNANGDIWLIELSLGTISRVTLEPTNECTPVWSPDGQSFLYGTFPAGPISLRDLSGSSPAKIILKSSVFKIAEQWSNDGKYLIYETLELRSNKLDVWALPFENPDKPFPFIETDYNESDSRLSPDGKWLSYISDETGQFEVYVRRFPASREKWRISTAGGFRPIWRNDGKELFFLSSDNHIMSTKINSDSGFEASLPEALFSVDLPEMPETRNQYTATADGQRFLVNFPYAKTAATPIAVVVNWCKAAKN